MLECLKGHFDEVYFTHYSNNSRAVPPEELQQVAEELTGRRWPVFHEPAAAWKAARRSATANDLICITGSFLLAAEMGPIVREETAKSEI
jgi:dihydrofolate synthase/folylpolyglutamate synthase